MRERGEGASQRDGERVGEREKETSKGKCMSVTAG